MRRERFTNDFQTTTTLTAAITNVQTTLTVASAANFPTEGDFRILIGTELLLVTSVSGTTFTVTRGIEGTTAAAYAGGTTVTGIITAGGLDQWVNDAFGGYTSGYPMRILNKAGTTLQVSNFTWVNQGTATAVDTTDGGIDIQVPSTASHNLRILTVAAPSTPWTLTTRVIFGPGVVTGATGSYAGLCARRNSTGQLYVGRSRAGDVAQLRRMTNPTTESTLVGTSVSQIGNQFWQQLQDNGTNIIYRVSTDGVNWYQLASEARGAFMVGGPDEVGLYVDSGGGVASMLTHFKCWVLTA